MTRRTILLVDDTKTIRAMERALLGPGFDYYEADDGAQALQLVAQQRPDLILMDIQMPVLDGVATLSELKQSEATRDIPVIMVTMEQDSETQERCRALGCAGFVVKPIRWQALVDVVRRYLPE